MASSPESVRLAAGAIRPLSDSAFDALRDAVLVVDTRLSHLPVVLANAVARRCFLGESDSTTLVDSSFHSLLGESMSDVIDAALGALAGGKPSIRRVLSWRFPSGEMPLATELKILPDYGQRNLLVTFCEPMTEPLSEPGVPSALEQSPLDLLILDQELTVTYANTGAAATAGTTSGAVLGYSALTLIPTSAVPREALTRALKGESYHNGAVAVKMPCSATRWFDVDVQPLKDNCTIVGLAVLSMEVTERRLRPRASVGGERRLLALTEHARDIISVVARDGTFVFVSGGIANALGYDTKERLSHSLFDLVHPDDVETLRQKFGQLAAGLLPSFSNQHRVRHRDGSYRWLESHFVAAFHSPLINGVVINARDVTDRKQVEIRLAQREEAFRLASDAVNGVIFEWDLSRGLVHRSRGVHDVIGMDPKDLEREGAWSARIHPRDRSLYQERIAEALRSRRGWTAAYRIRNVQGRYRSVLERGLIQRDPSGNPTRAIGCAVDVSEIKRLTDLLAETERAAKIGGWEYNYATGEVQWTDEMYRIYETTPQDFSVTWQSMMGQYPSESRLRLSDALDRANLTQGKLDLELEILTLKDRRVWVHVVGHVEMLEGRPFRAMGSMQDVQDKKVAQLVVQKSADWLELSMGMAHLHAWRWHRATDSLELAIVDGKMTHLPRVFPGMKKLLARVHPQDRLDVRRAIDHAFERHSNAQAEFRVRSRDGRYRYYAAVATPMFDEADQISGLVGVTQDITLRRESEARVRRSEELLRTTTANTSDALILVDTELRVRFANREVRGKPIDEIVGRSIADILPASASEVFLPKLRQTLATGERSTFEFEGENQGRTSYLEGRVMPVREEGAITGLSITVSNFTEKRRLEREILDASSRERHSLGRDLHDGLGQELTGVSFMLRGLATRIQDKCPEAAEQVNEIVDLVRHSIETARGLARGLLPVNADHGGLVAALQLLAQRSRELYGVAVECRAEVSPEVHLSETVASHLYALRKKR